MMNNSHYKLLLFLYFVLGVSFCINSAFLSRKLDTLSSEILSSKELILVQEERINLIEEKHSILEESIDTEDFRWAKTKKVRDAILQTIKEFSYVRHMSTVDLTHFSGSVVQYSEEFNVPISLILAIARQESAFAPYAKSDAGALGIMQVMPSTAREIASDLGIHSYNLFRISDGAKFGSYYITKMLDQFKGNIQLAIKAYNAGPVFTQKVESGVYEKYPNETIKYLEKVLEYKEYYDKFGL